MPEKVWERLEKVANGLHWLGRYEECNVLWMTIRLMKAHGIETGEQWIQFVEASEKTVQK